MNDLKAGYEEMPGDALDEVADVFALGQHKHGPLMPLTGRTVAEELAAARRHLDAHERGEEYDPEFETHHLAHFVSRGMIALQILIQGEY